MTPEQLDQMRRDTDALRTTDRGAVAAMDRVEAFERLYKALPQLVDDLAAARQQTIRDLDAGQITAEELTASGVEARHVVDFRDDGFTIQHPLTCRPNLLECPVNLAAACDLTEPPDELGRYACSLDDDGQLVIGDAVRGDQ